MLQAEGYGALRPLEVPVLLGIGGPLGAETAATIADGAFLVGSRPFPGFSWQASLFMGTVLRDDETYSSPRVMNAAGHAAAARYHYASENGKSLDRLPNAEPWEAAYAAVDSEVRHLEMQRGHLVAVNDRDRPFISDQSIQVTGAAFDQVELRDRMAALFASGVTEVAYQPAGDDIPGELDAFASALS
jgi:5,10-methylenetetrahydromethanopterin reductase